MKRWPVSGGLTKRLMLSTNLLIYPSIFLVSPCDSTECLQCTFKPVLSKLLWESQKVIAGQALA